MYLGGHGSSPVGRLKGSARTLATCRIMIVDDDAMIREVLRQLVECFFERFVVVAEASNGDEAVRMAEEVTPDLIIMDVRMPVMDGIEATRRIKHDLGLHGVVITCTSFGWREIKESAMAAGAEYHIRKPFEIEQLERILNDAAASATQELVPWAVGE